MMADARGRYKTINKLFKEYNVLHNRYRGDIHWHQYIFGAIANLVPMKIENGESSLAFQVIMEDIT